MGWTFMERPDNVKGYLGQKCNFENERIKSRCLAMTLKLDVMFAAVEQIDKESGRREVWAAVFLIKYIAGDDPYNFGYKDMTEHMGPYRYDCPEKILDLLTETDCENSINWRARCRARLERRTKVGDVIEFREPVEFSDGSCCQRFTIVLVPGRQRRRRALRGDDGGLYRIRGMNRRSDWTFVSRSRK